MTLRAISQSRTWIYNDTRDPTVNDDLDHGFVVGNGWLRTDTNEFFLCKDNANGAAVWIEAGGGSGGVVKSVDPTATDDLTKGYDVGEVWVNLTNQTIWWCYDNSENAAVWKKYNNLADKYPYLVGPISLAPYQDIQTAVDAASSGDTVWLLPGTYDLGSSVLRLKSGVNLRAVISEEPERGGESISTTIISGKTEFALDDASSTIHRITIYEIRFENEVESAFSLSGTARKIISFQSCDFSVSSSMADVIDLLDNTSPIEIISFYKSRMYQSNASYRLATINAGQTIGTYKCGLFGSWSGDSFAMTGNANLYISETIGGTDNDSLSGRIFVASGTNNRLILSGVDILYYGSGTNHVQIEGQLSAASWFFNSYTDSKGPLLIGGAYASQLVEKPVASDGDIWKYDGTRWQLVQASEITANISKEDRNWTAKVTTSPGLSKASDSTVTGSPVGAVRVFVNGQEVYVGDGDSERLTSACFFSNDPAGATARAADGVQSGDSLWWNGTIAGYDLTTSDRISLIYEV